MKFTMLWTDILVYLLVLLTLLSSTRLFYDKDLQLTWRKIIYRPLNMIALMILISYIFIGLLDTIHFQISSEQQKKLTGVVSILDILLTPIALHTERTYSAPFATHSFTKETIKLPDGNIVRDYPALEYGGAHLSSPDQKSHDISIRFLQASIQAFLIWGVLSVILLCVSREKSQFWQIYVKRVISGKTDFAWRTFLLTAAIIILLICTVRALMPYYHIFGTSQVGTDVLYQTLKSIRTGLVIGTVTTLVTLPFAILLGISAGYFRGWIDDAIQYLYTTLSSIPGVLLIAASVLTLEMVMERHSDWFQTMIHRADVRLLALCAILGITSWTGLCRLLRAETMKICQMDFVQAAYALGVSHIRIIFKHLLPNVFHIILITVVLDFSGLVLAEAVLSYVGVGVDPSSYSWGLMINGARLEMARVPLVWWSLTSAFIFMFGLVLAANIFSDAIRDAFDPRTHSLGVM